MSVEVYLVVKDSEESLHKLHLGNTREADIENLDEYIEDFSSNLFEETGKTIIDFYIEYL